MATDKNARFALVNDDVTEHHKHCYGTTCNLSYKHFFLSYAKSIYTVDNSGLKHFDGTVVEHHAFVWRLLGTILLLLFNTFLWRTIDSTK